MMSEQIMGVLVVGFGTVCYVGGHMVGRIAERQDQAARRRRNAQIQYKLDKARGNK